jgi:O-antigen/teichoic acid export membrane protein
MTTPSNAGTPNAPLECAVKSAADPAAILEPSAKERESSLRRLVIRGSAIELFGYGMNQLLRLLTNLVLSRLLFPEAYGLTAIVTVFLFALGMLSDVGLKDSVITSARGDDPRFLNTAWTIQILRGMGLWLVASLIAKPVAVAYAEPQLCPLIVTGSFELVIAGFASTSLFTLVRHVRRGPLVLLELTSKLLSMVVMFVWAWIHPSVWALVVGGLTAAVVEVIGSHMLPVGYRNRLLWEREAAREIRGFGKWIFGSSAFTFLAGEGDRLLLGHYLTMGMLGVYSIGVLLSSAVGVAVTRLAGSVFYGVFSQVARERREDVGREYYRARLRLDLLAMPLLGATMVFGPLLVGLLYDSRYHDAGWIVRILCLRVALQCALAPCSVLMIAVGQSRQLFIGNVSRFFAVWIGIPIGWHLGGLPGVVWATTFAELPMLVVFWRAMQQQGLFRPSRELFAPAAFAGGALASWAVGASFPTYVAHLH